MTVMWKIHCVTALISLLLSKEGISQTKDGDRCIDHNTYTIGVCRSPKNCDIAVRDLMNNGINPSFCVQSFTNSLVCCRQENSILYSASNLDAVSLGNGQLNDYGFFTKIGLTKQEIMNIYEKTRDNIHPASSSSAWMTSEELEKKRQQFQARISERKCTEYSRGVTQTVDFLPLLPDPEAVSVSAARCNYARVELIVGGEDAELDEFPHMAAIGWNTVTGGVIFKCGGSLISERFVLTAGHCLKATRDFQLDDLEPKVIRLGDQNLDTSVNDGANPVEIPIKAAHRHPEYSPPVRYNDIALLELATAVEFSNSIRPACLWNKKGFGSHTKAVATGWGVTRARSPTTSDMLQKVSLDLIDSETCNQQLLGDVDRNWAHGMADSQLCAGELRGGKDTCQGDSGGPLQVAKKENQCIFYLMGITSFGGTCAAGKPAVYTRVSEYIDWIESVVWPNGA